MSFYQIILLVLSLFLLSCSSDKPKEKAVSPSKKETTKIEMPQKEEATISEVEKEEPEEKAKEEVKKEEPKVVPIPPAQIKKAKEIIAGISAEDIGAVDAKKKYKMLCSVCHGFTGDLMINGAKDLTQSKLSLAESVAQIYHGRGLMTPFKGVMTDAEIVAVAKYIDTALMK